MLTHSATRLANLALPPPGIKFKASSMPFVQRENISHFLRACEMPPLNMHAHDRFLTVDLYDNKDPAQVIQCIGAFSRAANSANSAKFPNVIGPKKGNTATPNRGHAKDGSVGSVGAYSRSRGLSSASQTSENVVARALSPALTGGSNSSRAADVSRAPTVSSWSKRGDEGMTAPAWNIHQYGYMGGATQGNQGVSFGSRRQIVSSSVQVPSLAEKEKMRKEQELEAERTRKEQEEARRREDERDRLDEEQRWEEQARKAKEKQREELEKQRRQWEEEERRWKEEEEKRKKEEELASAALPTTPGAHLRGQFSSQFQAEQKSSPQSPNTPEKQRILDLEKQLEEARERERQYQMEREQNKRPVPRAKPARLVSATLQSPPASAAPAQLPIRSTVEEPARSPIVEHESMRSPRLEEPEQPTTQEPAVQEPATQEPSFSEPSPPPELERQALEQEWTKQQEVSEQDDEPTIPTSTHQPLPDTTTFERPIPPSLRPGSPIRAQSGFEREGAALSFSNGNGSAAPVSMPTFSPPAASLQNVTTDEQSYLSYSPTKPSSPFTRPPSNAANPPNRFERANQSPFFKRPTSAFANEVSMSHTAEQAAEDQRRVESQQATRAGGMASKSLMEREMERERMRQKEWEQEQITRAGGPKGPRAMR